MKGLLEASEAEASDLEKAMKAMSLEKAAAVVSSTVREDGSKFILNELTDCPICQNSFKRKGDLRKHLMKQHDIEPANVFYKCSCGTIIDEQKKFTRHVKHNGH